MVMEVVMHCVVDLLHFFIVEIEYKAGGGMIDDTLIDELLSSDHLLSIIVKLRQGSGKGWKGMVIKRPQSQKAPERP